jgi:hypothetical protein
MKILTSITVAVVMLASCSKGGGGNTTPASVQLRSATIDARSFNGNVNDVSVSPVILLKFSQPLLQSSLASTVSLTDAALNTTVPLTLSLQSGDSVLRIQPASSLKYISKYYFKVSLGLKSAAGAQLSAVINRTIVTKIDSTDKFAAISDNALLDLVQQQTLKYFWDFGHPVSGMARERNSSGDVVTTGGTGFGIMAIIAAVDRGFKTRTEGRDRILKITNFLLNNCSSYHGAFAHWIDGSTGATVPFSANDNGGDLVETSYLVAGLLCARQYFNTADATETDLRNKINTIWDRIQWNWYRQGNQNVLYWHWSPSVGWAMNMKIEGWNEALIVYALAASSNTDSIPPIVYTNGWAKNGGMLNGGTFYNYVLPLGPNLGGPLFFAQYSFLGIDPNGLTDQYANYKTQVVNHTKINYEYCKANPNNYFGYSNACWGLTASDVPGGYNANSPTSDIAVISPTAALSSFPYTPTESMNALKFFYYKLGDKIWKDYGFVDAFRLNDPWFADSYLAIDQGPIIVMIENYRSGLLWNLFTSCPEIKRGMRRLGFSAPYL